MIRKEGQYGRMGGAVPAPGGGAQGAGPPGSSAHRPGAAGVRLPERQLYGAGYGPVPVGYFPTLEPPQARWGVGVCPVRQ